MQHRFYYCLSITGPDDEVQMRKMYQTFSARLPLRLPLSCCGMQWWKMFLSDCVQLCCRVALSYVRRAGGNINDIAAFTKDVLQRAVSDSRECVQHELSIMQLIANHDPTLIVYHILQIHALMA